MPAARNRGLDGLRGAAVAAVVLFHVGWASRGFIGVDVFFVLSGYLITRLLLREYRETGRVLLLRFTGRRLLRLYPALLATALFVGLGSTIIRESAPDAWRDVLAAITYTSNLVVLHGLLDHTWTLALEEQFYLVWPLLLVLGLRLKRWPCAPAIALLGVILAADLVQGQSGVLHTYVRATGLPLGCALAIAPGLRRRLAPAGPAALVILLIMVFLPVGTRLYTSWPISLAALCAAPAVAWLSTDPPFPHGLEVARWLGLRSYSLYLWHFPLTSLVLNHSPGAPPRVLLAAVAILVSTAAAAASYRYVEVPVLAWRDRVRVPA